MRYKQCPVCGKHFEHPGTPQKYCSQECAEAGVREQQRLRSNRINHRKQDAVYLRIIMELAKFKSYEARAKALKKYCLLRKETYNLIKGE